MKPLNHILRKYTGRYKFTKSQEKINQLIYTDDIKLFAKNEKELETLIQTERVYSQNIRIEFDIGKMCHANNKKRETTHDKRNYQTQKKTKCSEKSKYLNTWEYWKQTPSNK